MILREWEFICITPTSKYKVKVHTCAQAIWLLLESLHKLNAMSALDNGYFELTYDRFRDNHLSKRFVVDTILPPSSFIIKKLTKGSINKNDFYFTLDYCKRRFKDENNQN